MSNWKIWSNSFLNENGPFAMRSCQIVEFTVPIKILSEANNSDHWTKKRVRKDEIRNAIDHAWLVIDDKPKPPCRILISRIAPRLLDYDNLVYSMRAVTNRIAELLLPGLAPGRADGDARLRFEYAQEKVPKTYSLRIKIVQRNPL